MKGEGLRRAAVVLFTRDLRVHDNPALSAAAKAGPVVPAFVLDESLLRGTAGTANRLGFLAGSLVDLHRSLERAGSGLLTRRGPWVDTVLAIARDADAAAIHVADDYSGFARRRLDALTAAGRTAGIDVVRYPGVTVVPPGEVAPAGRSAYHVFTPYWRAWDAHRRRAVVGAPGVLGLPEGSREGLRHEIATGPAPLLGGLPRSGAGAGASSQLPPGESAARARVTTWRAGGLADYAQNHDDVGAAATSNLSVYLKWGCLSALEVVSHLRERPGGEPFSRQICWRDFFHQVVAPQPDVVWKNLRQPLVQPAPNPRAEEFFTAWRDGQTGYPLVDAAMRQLHAEGYVHNRARLVAASFLTRDLAVPWWDGARHYLEHLVDGDVIVNNMNWQWVAGTGTDTNRHRTMSPVRQAERFDPAAVYIKRYLPEFSALDARSALAPDPDTRRRLGYPPPIVEPASSRLV